MQEEFMGWCNDCNHPTPVYNLEGGVCILCRPRQDKLFPLFNGDVIMIQKINRVLLSMIANWFHIQWLKTKLGGLEYVKKNEQTSRVKENQ